MFDVSFPELLLVAIVALLVLGPERLPQALRTAGLWIGRARRSIAKLQSDIEREVGADDIRRQLHNESIMAQTRALRAEADLMARTVRESVSGHAIAAPIDTPRPDAVATPAPAAATTPATLAGPAASASAVPIADAAPPNAEPGTRSAAG